MRQAKHWARRGAAVAGAALIVAGGCREVQLFFLEPDTYRDVTDLKTLMGNLVEATANAKRDYNVRDWDNMRRNANHLVAFSRELGYFSPTWPNRRGRLDAEAWTRYQLRLNVAAMELAEDVHFRAEGIAWEDPRNNEKLYYPGLVERHVEEIVEACNSCHTEFGIPKRIVADTKADAARTRRQIPLESHEGPAAAPTPAPAP